MKVSFINKHLIRPSYQSLSDLLHSWKFLSWNFIKPRCDSGQRSTFATIQRDNVLGNPLKMFRFPGRRYW